MILCIPEHVAIVELYMATSSFKEILRAFAKSM
jgi:hypothetical protein